MAMNAESIEALRVAIVAAQQPPAPRPHPNHKLQPLTSCKQSDWRIWKRNFLITCRINHWDDERARFEIASGMTGDAAKWCYNIDPEEDLQTRDAMLAQIESLFLPTSAGTEARSLFNESEQGPDEDVQSWHSRCRCLFERGYPDVENRETSRNLIDRFCHNLHDAPVRKATCFSIHDTYTAALQQAQHHNTMNVMHSQKKATKKAALNALTAAAALNNMGNPKSKVKETRTCYNCDKIGHLSSECRGPVRPRTETGRGGRGGKRGFLGGGRGAKG
jgi:hypothetical protein